MLGAGFWESPGAWAWEFSHPDEVAAEIDALQGEPGWAFDEYGDLVPYGVTIMPDTEGNASPETIDAVDRFKRAAQAFMQAYGPFTANRSAAYGAGLGGEWEALNERANTAQSYIAQIGDAIASAWNWSKSVFGLAGSRMGLLPAIPIAYVAIVAAIAWIVSITSDMLRFNQKMDAVRGGTLTAEQAGLGDTGTAGEISSMLKWGVAAAIVVTVLPQVLRAWERK